MTKKMSQSGELGVETIGLDAVDVNQQIAEIGDKSEREKIPLTKEVAEYTRANLRKVKEKLEKREPVYPVDMEFIGKVKIWMEMPVEWRKKYKSIERTESEGIIDEVRKREITPKQWFALLHVADFMEPEERGKWIDAMFKFPGNKKIEFKGALDLSDSSIRFLPDNLYVSGDFTLRGCKNLVALPDNLNVGGQLSLDGCTALTNLPADLNVAESIECIGCTALSSLPDDMTVTENFWLEGCTGLKKLPENLDVGFELCIKDCTGLTCLPENLNVGENLLVSENLQEQVLRDAIRLKKEGKIEGTIRYS